MRKTWLIPALLFGLFFCLYMVSLPVFAKRYISPLFFGADDMFEAYQGRPVRNLGAKHPLFLVTSPLYRFAKWFFSWAPADLAHNLSMVFPMAILGAAAVSVAYLVFLRNQPQIEQALSFAVFYGISGSTWFFASFPETYVLTALCSNLVLWSILGSPWNAPDPHVNRTAILNAWACYASPQQIFMSLIPFVRWLREFGLSRPLIQRTLRYAVVLSIAFVLPYQVFLKVTGMGWRFGPVYAQVYGRVGNLVNAHKAFVVALNFLLYSVVSPAVQPRYYTDPSLSIFQFLPLSWIVPAVMFLIFCIFSLRGLAQAKGSPLAVPLLAFLAVYLLFFLYFNPAESYLYTLPALLPWLLVLQTGFCNRWNRVQRFALYLLIAAIAVNNLHFRMYLSALK